MCLCRGITAKELGRNIFGFFLAQQEPQTGATTWLFQILAHSPDVVGRIRTENIAVRDGDKAKALDMTMQKSLVYTTAVVKEALRSRPPIHIIPYEITAPLPVTSSYIVLKGAIILPSYYTALHDAEAYPDPESFDPDRWIIGNASSKTKKLACVRCRATQVPGTEAGDHDSVPYYRQGSYGSRVGARPNLKVGGIQCYCHDGSCGGWYEF